MAKQFGVFEPVDAVPGALSGTGQGAAIQQQNPVLGLYRVPRFQDFTVPPGTYGSYAHQDAHSWSANAQVIARVTSQVNSHQTTMFAQPQRLTSAARMLFPKQVGRS